MTLAFSQKIENKPTYFVEKIWKGLANLPVCEEFNNYVFSEFYNGGLLETEKAKIHTIRADKSNRWKVGGKIHMVINNRSKNRLQFAPVLEVHAIQSFEIKYEVKEYSTMASIYIDEVKIGQVLLINCKVCTSSISVYHLAVNDGFDSINEFLEYFSEDFKGKIIHWTNFKY